MELNNDDHDDDIDDQYFDNVREEEEDVYDKEVLHTRMRRRREFSA